MLGKVVVYFFSPLLPPENTCWLQCFSTIALGEMDSTFSLLGPHPGVEQLGKTMLGGMAGNGEEDEEEGRFTMGAINCIGTPGT